MLNQIMLNQPILQAKNIKKSFTLHQQGNMTIPVFDDISFNVKAGECVVLHGESGLGKSTLLKSLYGNYLLDDGEIVLRTDGKFMDLCQASDRELIEHRQQTMAYVSQFLRVIPRVATLDIVMQPLLMNGFDPSSAKLFATDLLSKLNIPEPLWSLSPTTFSGGEQQRVNIAREFTVIKPLMLLDEPTASLDADNRAVVIQLIQQAKQDNAAIVGVFHDEATREQVADRIFDLKTGQFL